MRVLVPASARRSHRIIVDAESTRRDLAALLGTPLGKIDVAPLGVTPSPPVVAHAGRPICGRAWSSVTGRSC